MLVDKKDDFKQFCYGRDNYVVELEGFNFLAPLAGASELSFRKMCHRLGASQVFTELVSARGIRYSGIDSSWRYLEIDPENEGPVAIQLFGFDPVDFAYACEAILNHPVLSKLTSLDINMGCPVKKVVKTGAGSALMKDPELAVEIVKTCRKFMEAANKPVTCKFRKGFSLNENIAVDFGLAMAEAGVSLISYHARTRDQMYSGAADHESSKGLVTGLREAGHNIPIIINGDINSAEIARNLLRSTKADGVMIGREAMRNPFIFKELSHMDKTFDFSANRSDDGSDDYGGDCAKYESNAHCGKHGVDVDRKSVGNGATIMKNEYFSPAKDYMKSEASALKISYRERLSFAKEHYFDYVNRVGEDLASREIKMIFMKFFYYFPKAAQIRTKISGLKNMADYIEFFDCIDKEIDKFE